jgi:hypothetical protein
MFGRRKEDGEDQRLKQAMISAVNRALEYKRMNPKASDHDVLDHVVRSADDLLRDLD